MISLRSLQLFGGCLCVLMLTTGCGSDTPQLVPVSGSVTLDGQPLAGATVIFHPQVAAGGDTSTQVIESRAITADDGTFKLINIHDGSKGAMTGHHKVTVTKLVMKDGTVIPPDTDLAILGPNVKEVVPQLYTDTTKTTLTAEIADGGSEIFLDLKGSQ